MHAPALAASVRPGASLTGDMFARLEEATRTLLSPLSLPGVDAWRAEAMRVVCAVFEADQATFLLPGQPRPLTGWGLNDAEVGSVEAFVSGPFLGKGPSPEPLVEEFHRRIVAQRLEVWDMHSADAVLGGSGVAWDNLFYHEVLRPQRMADTTSLFVPTAEGSAHLAFHRFRRQPEPGEHLPLLRVLLPSFKAGLAALDRFAAHRAALDAVNEPVALFDVDGLEIHRNPAFTDLLGLDEQAALLESTLKRLVQRLRPFAFALQGERAALGSPSAEVHTARARYTLRGTFVGPGAYGSEGAILVSLQTSGVLPALPPPEDVRARFGLTRREAETALLVAQGLSNDAIAEHLFVSRHTVRHHVESLMAKLDLTGRGRESVAPRLLYASTATA